MELSKISASKGASAEFAHVRDAKTAASEFEAVLIGQLLSSAFSTSVDETDSTAQTMMDFGRDHLARVIAHGGGFGLTAIIEKQLKQ